MIEFFAIAGLTGNRGRKKNKENLKIQEMFNNESVTEYLTSQSINIDALNFVFGIISLIIAILTAKLAYQCNIKKDQVSQAVAVLFGFFFSGFYLIYHFIWHKILGNKC